MAYMDFLDAFENKVDAEGNDFLTEFINNLYSEGIVLNGQNYSVRRMSDEYIGENKDKVRTGFFCFPQNGAKDRMFQGGAFYVASDVVSMDGMVATLANPKIIEYLMPNKSIVYYGMVANKARKSIREDGANSFLFHDVMITTPEGTSELLDDFDFAKYQMFMLGLYGNEFKIWVRSHE